MEELVWGDSNHDWLPRGRLQTQGPGQSVTPLLQPLTNACSCTSQSSEGLFCFQLTSALTFRPLCMTHATDSSSFFVSDSIEEHELVTSQLKTGSDAHTGAYRIPTAADIPLDLRITLLDPDRSPEVRRQVPDNLIHSSKNTGEPPFFLGASVFFALKQACYAARKDAGVVPVKEDRAGRACAAVLVIDRAIAIFSSRGARNRVVRACAIVTAMASQLLA